MATIDLASNSALLSVAEKIAEQNQLLNSIAVRGKSAFVRYSAYADGTDFTETWSAGQNYIGHAVDFEAPTDKTAYTWSLFASNMRETLNITLAADAWVNGAQTIETLAIGDNSTVFPTPAPGSRDAYVNAGIQISAATSNSLIFTCAEVPTTDIVVEVFVTEPTAVVGGGGGLGQSDWAAGAGEPGEILNKPFGEFNTSLGDTLTWDGVATDNTFLATTMTSGQVTMEYYLHFISTSIPDATELFGGEVVVATADSEGYKLDTVELTDSTVVKVNDNLYLLGNEGAWLVLQDNVALTEGALSLTFPKKGIYFLSGVFQGAPAPIMYGKSLYVPGYDFVMGEIKKLDPKFVNTPDWNALPGTAGEILNKPFYDDVVELGETITWDGTLDDNTIKQADRNIDLSGTKINIQVYTQYVSSSVPTIDELATGTAFAISTGAGEPQEQELILADTELTNTNGVIAPNNSPVVMVATKDNSAVDLDGVTMRLPKKGVYVLKMVATQEGSITEQIVSKLTIPGYNFVMGDFKKLDSKFIPTPDWNAGNGEEGIILNRPFYDYTQEFSDTVTWDGEAIHENDFIMDLGPMGKMQAHYMATNIPTVDELLTGTFTIVRNGEPSERQPTESDIEVDEATGIIYVCNIFAVVPTAEAVLSGIATLKQPGIYAMYEGSSNGVTYGGAISIPGYNFYASNFKKLDSKFIDTPDWEATEAQVGYIKNRPFGKVIGTGDTLHKDIGYGELVSLMGFINCYHMCDKVPTMEELVGGTVEIAVSGAENVQLEITEDTFSDMLGDGGALCIQYKQEKSNMPAIFVIPESGYTIEDEGMAITFNKPGIYFNDIALLGITTVSLHILGYEFPSVSIKKIDPEYLPEGIGYEYESPLDIIEWDGTVDEANDVIAENTEDNSKYYMHKVSDCTPAAEDLVGGTFTYYNGEQETTVEIESWPVSNEDYYSYEMVTVALKDGVNMSGFTLPTKGIYFMLAKTISPDEVVMRTKSLTAPGVTIDTELETHKIDEKYIPDTLVRRDELEATIGTINGAVTVGQTIVVKAIDENGKPTEWEAVDMPTFELVSPNGTRYNLAVADDGTLSAVAIVEEPTGDATEE